VRRAMRYIPATIIGLAVGIFVGLAFGYRQGFMRGLRHLENDMAGSLAGDVEVASCVRLGDTERALRILELRLDGNIMQLAAAKRNLGFVVAPGGWSRDEALSVATVYRGVVPPSGHDASAVTAALAGIVSPGKRPLSPALEKLVHRAGF
jgi:hypothetical protein